MKNNSKSILARYEELQPKNGTKFTPREGFYFIQDVFQDRKHLAFYKATALWKETEAEVFNQEIKVVIALTALQQNASDPFNFDPYSVLEKAICVTTTFDGTINFLAKITPCVFCCWSICDSLVIIENSRPSFLDTLPDHGTIHKLIENFEIDEPQDDDTDLGDEGYGDEDEPVIN